VTAAFAVAGCQCAVKAYYFVGVPRALYYGIHHDVEITIFPANTFGMILSSILLRFTNFRIELVGK